MVRLKHRYLLVNILYPEQPPSSTPKSVNPILSIHRPSPDSLTPALLARIIRECVSELFGDWGVGKLGGANAGRVNVKYLSPATSTAIIRCPRESYRLVCATLSFINALPTSKHANFPLASLLTTPVTPTVISTSVSGGGGDGDRIPCVFHVARVSGTIKKAEEEAIRRARRDIARLMDSGDVKAGGGGDGELLDRILGTTAAGNKQGSGMKIDRDEDDDDDDDGQDDSDELEE